MLQVPYENVQFVAEELLPFAMRECVPIFPTTLDGRALDSSKPHYLGIEADVMKHWGEHLSEEEAKAMGLPTGKFSIEGTTVNYT